MEKHSDSSITTTRTTRLIYVEETSDTERRNSTYKSFEAENVEEVKTESSGQKNETAGKPTQTAKKPTGKSTVTKMSNKSMPLDVSQKIAEMTSPLKSMKVAKNSIAPLIPLSDNNGDESQEPMINVSDTEDIKNAKNAADQLEISQDKSEPGSETPTEKLAVESTSSHFSEQGIPANGEVHNGDEKANMAGKHNKEEKDKEAMEATEIPAEVELKNEVKQNNIEDNKEETQEKKQNGVELSPALTNAINTNIPIGENATVDVEKGVVEAEKADELPQMKTFSKQSSATSVISGTSMGASKLTGGDAPGGGGPPAGGTPGAGPPSRRSTRKNLLQHKMSKGKFGGQFEQEKTIEDSLLHGTLKPLLILMKITGIFFVPKKGTFGKTWREFLRSLTRLQAYCIGMCCVLFLNFVRSMFSFDANDGFSNELFLKFLTAIFMYESSSRAALAYWHSYKKDRGLTSFFLTVEKICYSDRIIPYESGLAMVTKGSIVVSIIITLSNVAFNAYGLLGTSSDAFSSYLVPVPPEAPGIIVMKIFVLFLLLINGLVAMLSLSFFTTVCYVLYKEFEYLCRTFVMKIKEDGTFADDLEKFRITHQKRCKLVEDADSMFKYYIANTYLTNVPLLCMLLYIIVYAESSDVSFRLINSFRLFYVLVQMAVVSWAATMINNQAHAPLGDVYSIRVVSCTTERQLEVNMFLNKLTGTQIGMTAWDMFVINKPTVLTVVGMVLTYFFLLVQFKNPLGEPTQCRCFVNASSALLRGLVTPEEITTTEDPFFTADYIMDTMDLFSSNSTSNLIYGPMMYNETDTNGTLYNSNCPALHYVFSTLFFCLVISFVNM